MISIDRFFIAGRGVFVVENGIEYPRTDGPGWIEPVGFEVYYIARPGRQTRKITITRRGGVSIGTTTYGRAFEWESDAARAIIPRARHSRNQRKARR